MSHPYNALHTFHLVVRFQSLKTTADFLHLTESAISHQIKSLEENLKIVLFYRKTRGVELTSAGHQYLRVVQSSLKKLELGTSALKQEFLKPILRITTLPGIAANIIIPRLSEFRDAHPRVELRIETGMQVSDLRHAEFDLAIRFGDGLWPGLISEKLFETKVFPACSQEFANKHALQKLAQIPKVTLLHNAELEESWKQWAKTFNIQDMSAAPSLILGSYEAVIQAAKQGLGLALAALPFEHASLESGSLVAPFDEVSVFPRSCFAAFRPQDVERAELLAFLDWFKALPEIEAVH